VNLTFQDLGNTRLIVAGEPRIDAAVAIQFKDRMREIMDAGPERFILDMSAVDFLDSSGLGAVVAAMKQVGAGKTFELAELTPAVKKVFALTRMDTVFRIHPNAQAALETEPTHAP